jgi:hypothetical protein
MEKMEKIDLYFQFLPKEFSWVEEMYLVLCPERQEDCQFEINNEGRDLFIMGNIRIECKLNWRLVRALREAQALQNQAEADGTLNSVLEARYPDYTDPDGDFDISHLPNYSSFGEYAGCTCGSPNGNRDQDQACHNCGGLL